MRLADSRTFCTAGSRRPIKTAMMAITTRSSINVKAERRRTILVSRKRSINGVKESVAHTRSQDSRLRLERGSADTAHDHCQGRKKASRAGRLDARVRRPAKFGARRV